jgi:hypothetical protein
LHQQFGVALNDGQDVVEIVRHAGGQLPHRLHFDRMTQLRLQIQPLGDVVAVAMHHPAAGHGNERPRDGAVLRWWFADSSCFPRWRGIPG